MFTLLLIRGECADLTVPSRQGRRGWNFDWDKNFCQTKASTQWPSYCESQRTICLNSFIKYNLDSIFIFSGKNNDLLSGLSEHLHTHTTSPNYLFSGHVTFCHEAGVACQLLPQSSPRVASTQGWWPHGEMLRWPLTPAHHHWSSLWPHLNHHYHFTVTVVWRSLLGCQGEVSL